MNSDCKNENHDWIQLVKDNFSPNFVNTDEVDKVFKALVNDGFNLNSGCLMSEYYSKAIIYEALSVWSKDMTIYDFISTMSKFKYPGATNNDFALLFCLCMGNADRLITQMDFVRIILWLGLPSTHVDDAAPVSVAIRHIFGEMFTLTTSNLDPNFANIDRVPARPDRPAVLYTSGLHTLDSELERRKMERGGDVETKADKMDSCTDVEMKSSNNMDGGSKSIDINEVKPDTTWLKMLNTWVPNTGYVGLCTRGAAEQKVSTLHKHQYIARLISGACNHECNNGALTKFHRNVSVTAVAMAQDGTPTGGYDHILQYEYKNGKMGDAASKTREKYRRRGAVEFPLVRYDRQRRLAAAANAKHLDIFYGLKIEL